MFTAILILAVIAGSALIAKKLLIEMAVNGEIVYKDSSPQTKALVCERYRIVAKPDLVRKVPLMRKQVINIQFKSRFKGIYRSDRAQLCAEALALIANGYKPVASYIELGTGERTRIRIPTTRHGLKLELQTAIAQARASKEGEMLPPSPSKKKCAGCAVSASCSHKK